MASVMLQGYMAILSNSILWTNLEKVWLVWLIMSNPETFVNRKQDQWIMDWLMSMC